MLDAAFAMLHTPREIYACQYADILGVLADPDMNQHALPPHIEVLHPLV
jgi:hypothetical protein